MPNPLKLTDGPTCDYCDNQATCYGKYEEGKHTYACDDCCGHGCEDGVCTMIRPEDGNKRFFDEEN